MKFPVYRKYSHNRTFFKVNSFSDFEELNIIGNYYYLRNFRVKIFSDQWLINDLIENRNNSWIEISQEEYENRRSYCYENLKAL